MLVWVRSIRISCKHMDQTKRSTDGKEVYFSIYKGRNLTSTRQNHSALVCTQPLNHNNPNEKRFKYKSCVTYICFHRRSMEMRRACFYRQNSNLIFIAWIRYCDNVQFGHSNIPITRARLLKEMFYLQPLIHKFGKR